MEAARGWLDTWFRVEKTELEQHFDLVGLVDCERTLVGVLPNARIRDEVLERS